MLELLQTQKHFFQQLFENDAHDVNFICSDFANERLNIYRQTIIANMVNVLKITFPGVYRLLGEACAKNAALAYCTKPENLPKSGWLDEFGEGFPSFLSTLPSLATLPYLADYAQFEWTKQLANIADDCAPLSLSAFQDISKEAIDNIQCRFIPACFLFFSKFPIFDIEHVLDNPDSKGITLKQTPAYGLIIRQNHEVCHYWLKPAQWQFINALSQTKTLLESVQHAQSYDDNFDMTETFSFMLKANLLKEIDYAQAMD